MDIQRQLYNIRSFSTSTSFQHDHLQELFKTKIERISRLGFKLDFGERKLIFFFTFGAAVFVNFSKEERKGHLQKLGIHSKASDLEVAEEDYVICVDPSVEIPKVSYDSVHIAKWDDQAIFIIALCMAKSNALELVESEVNLYLTESEKYMNRYQASWLTRILGRKKLIAFVANGLRLRHRLFTNLGLLEQPDVTWDSEELDLLFGRLMSNLDVEDRMDTVEKKLSLSADSSELLVDLSHNQHSELLEIIIILLIAVEIVQTFFGH